MSTSCPRPTGPSGGEVYLDGERVDELSEADWTVRRRDQVSYVFQFFNLIQNLSAADNIELAALMAGLPTPRSARRPPASRSA